MRRFYFIFLSALSLLVARGLITEIIRFFYPRPRPFLELNFQALIAHPGSAAFPSGHAVTFFVLAAVVFFMNKKYFYYFLGGAILNALARVAVGVHWPTDVLTGAFIGLVTVAALYKFLPKVKS
jgi:undecaprenyl-diphosphatase